MNSALVPTAPIQSLFDTFVNEALQANRQRQPWRPATDLTESPEAYRMALELPGIPRDRIQIELEGRVLAIRAERPPEIPEDGDRRLSERRHGRFERAFRLATDVDASAIEAVLELGVLHVTLPKKAEARARTIEILDPDAR